MGKIGFMFSGGGAQYPGMMKDLYDNIPECKDVFDEADKIVGYKLSNIIFYGTKDELSVTRVMIPAVFTADVASFVALKKYGITPDFAVGFSLGEWAAITAAGIIPFETALKLVQFRSEEMEKATPSSGAGMAVIMGKPNDYVEELCKKITKGYVCPANYNYQGQITISGDNSGLDELEMLANEEGTIYKRLPVNVPSHCILMEPAMNALEKKLENIVFNNPSFPIVSNCTAVSTNDNEIIKKNIITQLVSPVRFEQSIRHMIDLGVDIFIELGPGQTLFKFVRKISKNEGVEVTLAHVENIDALNDTIKMFDK